MRLCAVLAAATLCGGCFQSRTVDCGNGFLCPPDQACAAPGHCGDPIQVEKCEGKEPLAPCEAGPGTPGTCRAGICEPCTPDARGCSTGWHAMSSGTTVDLNDVWVRGPGVVFAVGNAGTLLHYDGIRWAPFVTAPPIPSDLDLQSIAGMTSESQLVIVSSDGGDRNVLRVQFGIAEPELSFEPMASYGMKAVWSAGYNETYVAGLGGIVRRFDGTAWQDVRAGGLPLTKIDGTDPGLGVDRIVAIGPSGSYALLADSTWTGGSLSAPATLTDVSVGAVETLVVGEARTLLRFTDPATPLPVAFDATVPVGLDLYGVWNKESDAYVVGDAGKILRSRNREQWSDASPNLGSNVLRAIDGALTNSGLDLFVAGSGGAIWHYSD